MGSTSHTKQKVTVGRIIDWLFYALYIFLIIVTILDMFGIPIPFVDAFMYKGVVTQGTTTQDNTLLKFLLILFSSVGVVVLNDKRELSKKVVNPLERVEELLSAGQFDNYNYNFFKNKDDFYIYFTQELKRLENGEIGLLRQVNY